MITALLTIATTQFDPGTHNSTPHTAASRGERTLTVTFTLPSWHGHDSVFAHATYRGSPITIHDLVDYQRDGWRHVIHHYDGSYVEATLGLLQGVKQVSDQLLKCSLVDSWHPEHPSTDESLSRATCAYPND